MNYPIRFSTHVTEKKSIEILGYFLPDEWIIREMNERDYGIDLYVEIVGKNNKITGNLAAIQIKGKKEIKFENDEFNFRVKRSTLNYWKGLPVPVFFVVVCIKTKMPYWASIETQEREGQFVGKGASTSVKIKKNFNFSDESSLLLFQAFYHREVKWREIEKTIEKSLMSYTSLGPFCLMCMRKDDNEVCSSTVQYILLQHFENFEVLTRYLRIKKYHEPKKLSFWYDEHIKQIKKENRKISFRFSHGIIKDMLRDFISIYREAIRVSNLIVTKKQKHYFELNFPYLYVHLIERPLTFVKEDWYSRYFYDEYENETQNITDLFFEDFDEYDNHLFNNE